MRVTAVDVLQAERNPAILVEGPEQAWRRSDRRQGGKDLRLLSVNSRRVGICGFADGLEKDASPVGEANSRGKARRKTGRRGSCFQHRRTHAFFQRGAD